VKLLSTGREVVLVSAIDREVTVRTKGANPVLVTVEPVGLKMSPEEWGVLSNLGGTENLTRWYGYDYPNREVVTVVPA
jgi:hypothetical protein